MQHFKHFCPGILAFLSIILTERVKVLIINSFHYGNFLKAYIRKTVVNVKVSACVFDGHFLKI